MSIPTQTRIRNFFNKSEDDFDFTQFQETAIQVLIVFTCLVGIALALFGADLGMSMLHVTVFSLGLIIPSMVAMFLTSAHFRLSILVLYIDWLVCSLSVILLASDHTLLALLTFPIFFSAFFISPLVGLLTWVVTALATLYWPGPASLSLMVQDWKVFFSTSLVFVFILWLGLRSYHQMIHWLWANFQQNNQELTDARDQRGQLNQAVHDLAEANIQMKRLNQLLNAARYQAEEAERVKAEFVANVSHELRTPLNMILGYCELIIDFPAVYGGKLPGRLLADIAAVQRNSQYLVHLIGDVLDISQIEAKHMTLRKDWVSIKNIINEVVIAVQPLIESRNLFLKLEIPEELPLLNIDQTRIRQVLLNLVSNAARVTETGGITIQIELPEEQLKVIVSDTGPGILPEDLPKLFQPFRQLNGSAKPKPGGSGLGLNISRNFVELHGGKIGVESQVGKGSHFWFVLPVQDRPDPSAGFGRWMSSDYDQRMHPTMGNPLKMVPRVVVLEPSDLVFEHANQSVEDVELKDAATPGEALVILNDSPCQAVIVRGETEEQSSEWAEQVKASQFETPVFSFALKLQDYRGQLEVEQYLLKPVENRRLLEVIASIRKPIQTILLVDDDSETLQLFTRLLTNTAESYKVLTSTSGEEALSLLKSRHVDLIILDLNMPGMGGLSFLKEKARLPKGRSVPVVILSAEDPAIHPLVVSSLTVNKQNGFSIPDVFQFVLRLGEE